MLVSVLLLLFFSIYPRTCDIITSHVNDDEDSEVKRSFSRRDLQSNIDEDDPEAYCRNGGILKDGICQCKHPHTGKKCQDFACKNKGISVGHRYDPNSLLFSKPCICEGDWRGDLCDFRPSEDCHNHGEMKNRKCVCYGSYYGDACQFTKRCDNGILKNGRCICTPGYEGQYCERIVCKYGYPNVRNHSLSCLCPAKYKGLICDSCSQDSPEIRPFPICTPAPPKPFRHKASDQLKWRVAIMVAAIAALFLFAGLLLYCQMWARKRRAKRQAERDADQEMVETSEFLSEGGREDDDEVDENVLDEQKTPTEETKDDKQE